MYRGYGSSVSSWYANASTVNGANPGYGPSASANGTYVGYVAPLSKASYAGSGARENDSAMSVAGNGAAGTCATNPGYAPFGNSNGTNVGYAFDGVNAE